MKRPRWNRGGDWHPPGPCYPLCPVRPAEAGSRSKAPASLTPLPAQAPRFSSPSPSLLLPSPSIPVLGSCSGVPVLPTQWTEGQGLPWAAGAVGAPPGGRVWVVRRPPGVAISLRGMCGWGKQMFLGGSDTCPWNSSQGLPLCSTLSHSLHFEKQLSKESGVLNGGSEAADRLTSGLTAGLRVV